MRKLLKLVLLIIVVITFAMCNNTINNTATDTIDTIPVDSLNFYPMNPPESNENN